MKILRKYIPLDHRELNLCTVQLNLMWIRSSLMRILDRPLENNGSGSDLKPRKYNKKNLTFFPIKMFKKMTFNALYELIFFVH